MARLYIKFETMAAICDASAPSTVAEVVRFGTTGPRVATWEKKTIADRPGRMQGQLCVPQLTLVASTAEFAEFRFQPGNKMILNAINKSKESPVPFPIRGPVKTVTDKVSLLLQVRSRRDGTAPTAWQPAATW